MINELEMIPVPFYSLFGISVMKFNDASDKTTMWERTGGQNLLRNRQNGHYYGRLTIAGKQKWWVFKEIYFRQAKADWQAKPND